LELADQEAGPWCEDPDYQRVKKEMEDGWPPSPPEPIPANYPTASLHRPMTTAFLPAQLLHVAAQFASTDPAKQLLTGILVRPARDEDGKEIGGIRIDSTDGTRAFSVTCPDTAWECDKPILLSASAFKKRISYAVAAEIEGETDELGNIRILGGKTKDGTLDLASGRGLTFMQSIPAFWQPTYAFVGDPAEQYPKVDQIWPSQFGRDTDTPIAFNAALLADFLTEVKRYSTNDLVTMQRNGAINPMVFTSEMSGAWLNEVEMRFLLCPVEIGGAAARAS
jgi:hypothetical protein